MDVGEKGNILDDKQSNIFWRWQKRKKWIEHKPDKKIYYYYTDISALLNIKC